MDEHICGTHGVHKDIVEKVAKVMPDEALLFEAAELLKVLGDATRVRIIFVLCQSEMCVCDIARLLNMTQSAISHQLRVLRTAGLIKVRRCGKSAFYSLDDDHVKKIIEMGFEHINEKD